MIQGFHIGFYVDFGVAHRVGSERFHGSNHSAGLHISYGIGGTAGHGIGVGLISEIAFLVDVGPTVFHHRYGVIHRECHIQGRFARTEAGHIPWVYVAGLLIIEYMVNTVIFCHGRSNEK